MPRLREKGSYRSFFVMEDRAEDFARVQAWLITQAPRRYRAPALSLSDAVLDIMVGYLDILESKPRTPMAEKLLSKFALALLRAPEEQRVIAEER